ncbi:MAG: hypothetical protein HY957_07765 [Nitrospirae bacterium]|nr:hypothetical protein [Nitrospirota bacterium]
MKGILTWLFQRIAGVILISGLAAHFTVMHFSGSGRLGGFSAELVSTPCFNAVFLASAIYHGFYGLWGIAVEYIQSKNLLKTVQALLFSISALLLTAWLAA